MTENVLPRHGLYKEQEQRNTRLQSIIHQSIKLYYILHSVMKTTVKNRNRHTEHKSSARINTDANVTILKKTNSNFRTASNIYTAQSRQVWPEFNGHAATKTKVDFILLVLLGTERKRMIWSQKNTLSETIKELNFTAHVKLRKNSCFYWEGWGLQTAHSKG